MHVPALKPWQPQGMTFTVLADVAARHFLYMIVLVLVNRSVPIALHCADLAGAGVLEKAG